jgi:hypothetical protein
MIFDPRFGGKLHLVPIDRCRVRLLNTPNGRIDFRALFATFSFIFFAVIKQNAEKNKVLCPRGGLLEINAAMRRDKNTYLRVSV